VSAKSGLQIFHPYKTVTKGKMNLYITCTEEKLFLYKSDYVEYTKFAAKASCLTLKKMVLPRIKWNLAFSSQNLEYRI
jgi:hypothetical protein